jgi:hypothetical protein
MPESVCTTGSVLVQARHSSHNFSTGSSGPLISGISFGRMTSCSANPMIFSVSVVPSHPPLLCFCHLCVLTRAGMPGNVAMHQPCTGVIRLEGQCEIPSRRQHGDVPAGRVVPFEVFRALPWIPRGAVLREDHEIRAVQMDWVGCSSVSMDPAFFFVLFCLGWGRVLYMC